MHISIITAKENKLELINDIISLSPFFNILVVL